MRSPSLSGSVIQPPDAYRSSDQDLAVVRAYHDVYEVDNRVNSFHVREVDNPYGYQIRVAEPTYAQVRMWQETATGVVEVDASSVQGGAGKVIELKLPTAAIGEPDRVELSASVSTIDYDWYDTTISAEVTVPD